jgi:hypothetical protein
VEPEEPEDEEREREPPELNELFEGEENVDDLLSRNRLFCEELEWVVLLVEYVRGRDVPYVLPVLVPVEELLLPFE